MKNLLPVAVSGLLLTLAWPTWGFAPLLFIAFVPLLLAEYRVRQAGGRRKGWKVLGLAYLTFFLWNLTKTYWLWFSTEFGAAFAILVNSLLMALVFLFYHRFAQKANFFISSVFLTTLWICFEKFHLGWDLSWPWLNLGNGFSEYYSWVQWYEYTGTFGGTLWVWVVNFGIFKTFLTYEQVRKKKALIRGAVVNGGYILLPVLFSLLLFYTYDEKGAEVEVVVLQPNVDPYSEKYFRRNEEVAKQLFELAEPVMTANTAFVIAPETVFADDRRIELFPRSEGVKRVQNFTKKHDGISFLGGISLYKVFNNPELATPQTNLTDEGIYYNTYNSAFFVSGDRDIDLYHKSKLVVGVESTPYPGIIKPLLGDIMLDLGGTVAMKTTQEERGVFSDPSGAYRAAPIICYESVYGQFVTGYVRNGANFLTIITNDGWWGQTQGHKQHLSYARLRAIETRRDIARSANTGISAFVDQKGQITQTLAYDTPGALAGTVRLNEELTFYTRYGDLIYRISLFLLIGVVLIVFTKRRNTGS